MKTHTKYTALITSSLLIVALAGPANATTPKDNAESAPTTGSQPITPISADKSAVISYEKPAVKAVKAEPVFELQPVEVEATAEVESQTSTPAQKIVRASVTKTETAPVAPVSASGKGAAIAAAAYAQLGVAQDCTALVTNSLAAVGIHFHGWPAEYLALGTVVSASEAQAGDLAYYPNGGMGVAHIAVYVGNGMAVHGGWNGGTTALFSANVGSGPVFIRVA
jgi:cell wall-associated NlpC family hydrolase